jgi:hypothetical protein
MSSEVRQLTPVRLPPGRARLATKPVVTASQATITTGTVRVTFFAAMIASSPAAMMTSTLASTNSRAKRGSSPAAHPRNDIPPQPPGLRCIRVRSDDSGKKCATGMQRQSPDNRLSKPFHRLCKSRTEARKEQGGREKRNPRSSLSIEVESSESHSIFSLLFLERPHSITS